MNKTTKFINVESVQFSNETNNTDKTAFEVFKTNFLTHKIFLNNLHPKRASVDLKYYLQLYHKKSRQTKILKSYQDSMQSLKFKESHSKGFRGKKYFQSSIIKSKIIPQNAIIQKNYINIENGKSYNFASALSNSNIAKSRLGYESTNLDSKEQTKIIDFKSINTIKTNSRQKPYQRPNLMYNLSLCRKSYNKNKETKQLNRTGKDYHKINSKKMNKTKRSFLNIGYLI